MHDAANTRSGRPLPSFLTITAHTRQTPTGFRSSLWHSAGMWIPARRAASITDVFSGTVTDSPSIVSVIIFTSDGGWDAAPVLVAGAVLMSHLPPGAAQSEC